MKIKVKKEELKMIESAKNISVEKLLSKDDNNKEFVYKIPPYQREYSWGKEQWENLFDDINDNEEGYFLGSIICINSANILDVIDGQQRLTTISILLNSLLSIINKFNKETPEKKLLDLSENEESASMWMALKKFLFLKDIGARLTLSIQNQNNEDYLYLLASNNLENKIDLPKNYGNRRISKAYEYFKSRLLEIDDRTQRNKFSIEELFFFLKKVESSMMVKIDVDGISSAFTLFESINNRGMPLTPIDLIKNSIIGEMGKKDSFNKPEEINKQWQTIVKNIEEYDDQVRFLRHYYHAFQNKQNIKITTYTKATKSNIIKIYSEHIKKDVTFIFNELIEKSKIYTAFVHPENINDRDIFFKYKNKLVDLQRLGIAPSYSLLLYLFSDVQNNDFNQLVNFLENWFIRRHLTDYPATNKLDQLFLDLIGEITEKGYSLQIIKEFMMTKERYKDDVQFKELLINSDLYTVNTGATRCMLTKLEKSKRTKENEVDFWALSDGKKLVWSIEHILPQNPDDKSDWGTLFSEEERKNNVHKLGNLTLTCYNSSLSNNSFGNKISVRDKDGKDIGLISGNVLINSNLTKDSWTKTNIENRSNILATEIIELFSNA